MNRKVYPHGGNVRMIGEEYGISPDSIYDFSANINPLGPSPVVERAVRESLNQIERYPDLEYKSLREAIAGFYHLPADCLILGNGGAEIIFALCFALRPAKVLIPSPTFGEYGAAARAAGSEVAYVRMGDEEFILDPKQITDALLGCQMLFLCTPNNPTGRLIPPEHLFYLLFETAKTKTVCVVDESFLDFVPEAPSLLPQIQHYEHLVIVRSLTKFFALPGLRIGFGAACPSLAKKIRGCLPPWNVNCMAEAAAIAALNDRDYQRQTIEFVQREREHLFQKLQGMAGVKVFPGAANFLFLDIAKTGRTSSWWQQALLQERVLVRNCNSYPYLGEGYLRIAVRTREENEIFLKAFEKIHRQVSSLDERNF